MHSFARGNIRNPREVRNHKEKFQQRTIFQVPTKTYSIRFRLPLLQRQRNNHLHILHSFSSSPMLIYELGLLKLNQFPGNYN
ncbi:hypothetical protein Lal_00018637 [Lupinus albus]|nr:hypothetical protein Lal_00018637 [Lupinus albus]